MVNLHSEYCETCGTLMTYPELVNMRVDCEHCRSISFVVWSGEYKCHVRVSPVIWLLEHQRTSHVSGEHMQPP
jgi:hypothetical protein